MDRDLQISLLSELNDLCENKAHFLDDRIHAAPVERYFDVKRFEAEQDALFKSLPQIAAHSSELATPGSYLTVELSQTPVLLTRTRAGELNAFLNVCRHRGARLVGEDSGCKNTFSCPYHGWTWDAAGQLRGVPHERDGFPDLNRAQYGLHRLPVHEANGLIWVVLKPGSEVDFEAHIQPITVDLDWIGMDKMVVAASDHLEVAANWKIIVEGGIEAYHFRVTHKNTIGPHFLDNLSSFQMLGRHMRSILPRVSVSTFAARDGEDPSIRDHANILYSLMAADQFLLMQDHVAWIHADPLSADRTQLRISTLVPGSEFTEEKRGHWVRNHEITKMTLREDFDINEAIQKGLKTGANKTLTFGRFESALARFNAEVERYLSSSSPADVQN